MKMKFKGNVTVILTWPHNIDALLKNMLRIHLLDKFYIELLVKQLTNYSNAFFNKGGVLTTIYPIPVFYRKKFQNIVKFTRKRWDGFFLLSKATVLGLQPRPSQLF